MGQYVLNGKYKNLADPGNNILIPSTSEQKIIGSDWNSAASLVETMAGSVDTTLRLLILAIFLIRFLSSRKYSVLW